MMKLTVVIITQNNLEGLRKTLNSVISQSWQDFECIIVDVGSTDGSIDLIEEYASKGHFSWWGSILEGGFYRAMNKGVSLSKGKYIQFLTSGDCYSDPNVLKDFSILNYEEAIISGDLIVDGNIDNYHPSPSERDIDFEFMMNNSLFLRSSFVRREIFQRNGAFDESLEFLSEWKFFLVSLIQYSCTYKKWRRVVVNQNSQDLTKHKKELIQLERKKITDNFLPYVVRSFEKKESLIHSLNIPSLERIKISLCSKIRRILHRYYSIPCQLYLQHKRSLFLAQKNTLNESKEKIIVSMTSWKKRINNISETIISILQNTILPDFIVLNLSIEEFPNKELDLPETLLRLKTNNAIRINWLNGNDRAFKKIIPTIQQYPDDIIISIDDDFIYPNYFIETFITQHKLFPQNPLSGNLVSIGGVQAHCGCASLVKSSYYGPFLTDLLDETIIKIGMDDIFYTYCAILNNVHYKYVGRMFFYNMIPNNAIDGLSDGAKYNNNDMISYLNEKVKQKYYIDLSSLSEPVFVI